ncbi:hypothetical protein [Aquimarina sp. I32.4]|uniref:hypothetical protein n=1 Tax=Aquimarina sp. I32.4 TaxID=2053903 RepID=UPI0018EB9E2A|nr:hypothetical protein [Aquimarina sp. I32.4]
MHFKIKAYFNFFCSSTNQHGVHSPFVYNLVSKCFYNKKQTPAYATIKSILKKSKTPTTITYKVAKLLNRTLSYFESKRVLVLANSADSISQILSTNNEILIDTTLSPNSNEYDMIYLDIDYFESLSDLTSLHSKTHNDSIVIINSIHNSRTSSIIWEKIKKDPYITVTIDTFFLGFVFIRKEQAKEDFIIRT